MRSDRRRGGQKEADFTKFCNVTRGLTSPVTLRNFSYFSETRTLCRRLFAGMSHELGGWLTERQHWYLVFVLSEAKG